jgi:hypothetical protein
MHGILCKIYSESRFHLSGSINKQNTRFLASENSRSIMETSLRPAKCTMWCAFSKQELNSLSFVAATVTSQKYLRKLQNDVIPVVPGAGHVDTAFFQQDGVCFHTVNVSLVVIYGVFHLSGSHIMSDQLPEHFVCGWYWPLCSLDTDPCNCFLWDYHKDCVYCTDAHLLRRNRSCCWRGRRWNVAWHIWQICG